MGSQECLICGHFCLLLHMMTRSTAENLHYMIKNGAGFSLGNLNSTNFTGHGWYLGGS